MKTLHLAVIGPGTFGENGNGPYSVIKNVMNSLQDLRENRYNLITSLKAESEN